MEALMQHYKAAEFSDEVSKLATAPGRPATNRMYDDWWLRFTHSLCGYKLFMWLQAQDKSSQSQAHTRLFERDSGPPIQTQSAIKDRVESQFQNPKSNF